MSDIHVEVSSVIRRRREGMGLSQNELAEMAGLSQPHISAIETGKIVPGLGTLDRLAAGLGTTVSALLSEGEGVCRKIRQDSG